MSVRSWTAASLLLIAAATTAAPAMAQSDGPFAVTAISDGTLAELVDLCSRITVSLEAVDERAGQLDWGPEVSGGGDEFYSEVAGGKELAGVGSGELIAFIEYYPSQRIAVCKVDVQDPQRMLDVGGINLLSWLRGSVNDFGDAIFGSWEEPVGEASYFVQAYQLPDFFSIQITALSAAGKTKN
jgi:hypothetical protein